MKKEERNKYNRIYAYTTVPMEQVKWKGNRKGVGLIKIGQTTLDTEGRVRQQLQGSPQLLNGGYKILLDEEALKIDGSYFTDHDIFKRLKAMKVHRIKGTEWFEATIEEVKTAFNHASSGLSLRTFSHETRNTPESRGSKYNKAEAQREKNFIKSPDRILNVMRLYKDAKNLVKIGKRFCEYYNIKQYAPSSVSNFIGEVMKDLIKQGLVENRGTQSLPNLVVLNKTVPKSLLLEKKKPSLTMKGLKGLINLKKDGISMKELKDSYSLPNISYLYGILDREFIKIVSMENGRRCCRYVSPLNYKVEKESTSSPTSENIFYSGEDVVKLKRSLKLKSLKSNKKGLKSLKTTGLSYKQIEKIITDHFPKLIVKKDSKGELCVYRKSVYTGIREQKEEIRKKEKEEYFKKYSEQIYSLLRGKFKEGVSAEDVAKELNWNKSCAYRVLKEMRKFSDIVTIKQPSRNSLNTAIILSENYNPNPFLDSLPYRARCTAFKHSVTKEEILEIIKDNVFCSSIEICKALLKHRNLSLSRGYFDEVVAAAKRYLLKEGSIIKINKTGNVALNSGTLRATEVVKLDIEKIYNKLKKSPYGLTTKEIYSLLDGTIGLTLLGTKMKKLPMFKGVRVVSEKCKTYYYKWFLTEQKIALSDKEDLYEAFQV